MSSPTPKSPPENPPPLGASPRASRLNFPNLLSGFRFVGSFVLVALAWSGGGALVVPLFLVLLLSDWIDGKLAILWKQQTTFGARLDSLADVTFYSAVLIALALLKADVILAELAWIVPAIVAYGLSCLVGWLKFRKIPTYHTRGAKTGWLLAGLTVVAIFAREWHWPVRALGIWELLVNVEAILITLVLPTSLVDVPSLYHAYTARRRLLSQNGERDRSQNLPPA
ncbi:MAG: CDP-alcohol phosphatidyltransferase family protein [Pirellulales bacterium]